MLIKVAQKTYEVDAKIGDRLTIYQLPGEEEHIYIYCVPDGKCLSMGCDAHVLADVVISSNGVSGWMHGVELVC